jgi:hypothetical protein
MNKGYVSRVPVSGYPVLSCKRVDVYGLTAWQMAHSDDSE